MCPLSSFIGILQVLQVTPIPSFPGSHYRFAPGCRLLACLGKILGTSPHNGKPTCHSKSVEATCLGRIVSKVSAEWPLSRSVEIWNSVPASINVKKFQNRI